jgi:hypothetical protein
MMSNLTEIAKENGALPLPVSRNEQQYIFTDAQLQATVEQVCRPLIKALHQAETDLYHAQIRATYLNEVFSDHRKLMGQDK